MENWIDYELLQIKNKCLDLVRKNSEDFGKRNVLYSSGHIQLTNKELNEYLKDEIKSLIKEYNLKNKKINELEEYLYKWIIDLEKEIKNVYVKKGFSMSLIEWLKLNDDDKIKNIFDKYRQI